jgi:hypothetical protein
MKDFIGRELKEGDFVAATRPNYKDLVLGRIVAFTPKRVRVEYKLHYGDRMDTHLYHSSDLVKLDGPHLTMKLLKGE